MYKYMWSPELDLDVVPQEPSTRVHFVLFFDKISHRNLRFIFRSGWPAKESQNLPVTGSSVLDDKHMCYTWLLI